MKGEKFFKNDPDKEKRILEVKGEKGLLNIGLEKNLYQIEAPGFSANDIEEIFKEYGEDFLDDIILKIRGKQIGEAIDQEIKNKLSIFLGAMRVRTPLFKWETEESSNTFSKHLVTRQMENISTAELKKEMEGAGKKYTEEQIEIARRTLVEKKYELKWPNSFFLKFALSGLEMHADIFHDMKMTILMNSNSRYFITSDNPVVYFVPKEKVNFYNAPKSLISPHTEVFFPLTRDIAIHLSRKEELKELIMDAKRDIVDIFNYNVSYNSFNFIFSPIKMNSLNEFVESYIPYPFRIVIK
jgi:hypothetical protein